MILLRQEESDSDAIESLEMKLGELANSFRKLNRQCALAEYKDLFNLNHCESLRVSILSIENVLEPRPLTTKLQRSNRLIDLDIIDKKYSSLYEQMRAKTDAKLEELAQQKLKAEREAADLKLFKERQALELIEQKQAKYTEELSKYDVKYLEVKKFLSHLTEKYLSGKQLQLDKLGDRQLLEQATSFKDAIQLHLNNIALYVEKNVNIESTAVNELTDKELNSIFSNLKENLISYIKIGEGFERELAQFSDNIDKKIEAEKERKAAEEALKIEHNRQLEENTRLSLIKQQETQQAKAKSLQLKLDQQNLVKSVNDDDKKGINHLTFVGYEANRNYLDKLRVDVEEPLNDKSLKMYKFDLQKSINFPLNSLLDDKTNEDNKRNFNEKIKTLLRLLAGQTCVITSTLTVNPSKHPLGVDFCMIYLARKIVEKGLFLK